MDARLRCVLRRDGGEKMRLLCIEWHRPEDGLQDRSAVRGLRARCLQDWSRRQCRYADKRSDRFETGSAGQRRAK